MERQKHYLSGNSTHVADYTRYEIVSPKNEKLYPRNYTHSTRNSNNCQRGKEPTLGNRIDCIDSQTTSQNGQLLDENIYSEPVFDESYDGDDRMPDQDTNSSKKDIKNIRMEVLESIPPNYVLFVPKRDLENSNGIISCTLVPRDMVTNMIHILGKGIEEEPNEEPRKTPDIDTIDRNRDDKSSIIYDISSSGSFAKQTSHNSVERNEVVQGPDENDTDHEENSEPEEEDHTQNMQVMI